MNPPASAAPSPLGTGPAPGVATPSLAFRDASDSDLLFVVDSWLSSFRSAFAAGPIPMHQYKAVYRDVIAWVLARPGARVVVAYHPRVSADTLADIYGWACCESPQIVHYVFTKQAFRRNGIARMAIEQAGVNLQRPYTYTFKTSVVKDVGDRLGKWDPLAARYPAKEKDRSK